MQRLEVSGAVRPLYGSLGVKGLRLYCGFLVGDAIDLDVTPAPVPRPSSVAAVRIKGPSLCQDYFNPGVTRSQRATAASACISAFRPAASDLSSGV